MYENLIDWGKHGDLWESNHQIVSLFIHDYSIIYVALLKKGIFEENMEIYENLIIE